jgi:hypothetical protein
MKRDIYMQSPTGEVFTTSNPEYHKECRQLTQKEGKIARAEYCKKQLRKILKPGATVFCVLRSVSRSGMNRTISFFAIQGKDLRNLDAYISDALGYRWVEGGGLSVSGCGMDMGFSVVHNLGSALWPKGTKKPHGRRNGEDDFAGGYALKHSWL